MLIPADVARCPGANMVSIPGKLHPTCEWCARRIQIPIDESNDELFDTPTARYSPNHDGTCNFRIEARKQR